MIQSLKSSEIQVRISGEVSERTSFGLGRGGKKFISRSEGSSKNCREGAAAMLAPDRF